MKIDSNSIIIPILAGIALGTLINRNEDLIQGLSDYVIYGAVFVYIGISRLINARSHYETNTFGKKFASIFALLLGLLLILGPIFIRPCDFDMAGIQCNCRGVKIDPLENTFLDSNGDTEPENYCVGVKVETPKGNKF